MRPCMHANAKTFNQLPAEPTPQERQPSARKRKQKRNCVGGRPCDVATKHPTTDEQQKHNDVANAVQQADSFRTGAWRYGELIKPAEQHGGETTNHSGHDHPVSYYRHH